MAFIVRPTDRVVEVLADGVQRAWIIEPDRLADRRLNVAVVSLPAGATYVIESPADGLAWFQIMSGSVELTDPAADTASAITADHIVMATHGRGCVLSAGEPTVVMVVRVPVAEDATGVPDLRIVDWSTEPVLLSEHDARRRIYLASTGLWGTEAVKGEMIFYPPGAVGAPHHHEGAEHFQFLTSGAGTAILGDERVELAEGDLLYNFENEIHSFENLGDEDMIFVEFFVPGRNRTVWVPGAEACAWNPLDTDVLGRPAARRLQAHVHGEGSV